MEEKRNNNWAMIYIIIIGILLWGFYFIQEEFAKYGMYQLISYRVHEISSAIPLLSILRQKRYIILHCLQRPSLYRHPYWISYKKVFREEKSAALYGRYFSS